MPSLFCTHSSSESEQLVCISQLRYQRKNSASVCHLPARKTKNNPYMSYGKGLRSLLHCPKFILYTLSKCLSLSLGQVCQEFVFSCGPAIKCLCDNILLLCVRKTLKLVRAPFCCGDGSSASGSAAGQWLAGPRPLARLRPQSAINWRCISARLAKATILCERIGKKKKEKKRSNYFDVPLNHNTQIFLTE
ncbi:hypothetical protein CEXT_541501 [Caerostris extrusa]|uniref:Uncharacterized protein n=1 Tax=Caerostris extrusa TaxID=172846 RepID=A0AAV4UMW2_CAEEX|nr:hypothetical protein CEXT_541501 [Caerostris extrusa]